MGIFDIYCQSKDMTDYHNLQGKLESMALNLACGSVGLIMVDWLGLTASFMFMLMSSFRDNTLHYLFFKFSYSKVHPIDKMVKLQAVITF